MAFTYRTGVERGQELERELSLQCQTSSSYVDLRDAAVGRGGAARRPHERFGSVGTVIFAAGVNILQPYVSEISAEQWQEVVQTELIGFTHLIRATIPLFRSQGGGTIVAIGTVATYSYPPGDALSAVPKAATEMLCRAVARGEGRYGIRANVVAPGIINAGLGEQFQQKLFGPKVWETQRNRVALKRFGEAAEIAEAAAFLHPTDPPTSPGRPS